MLPFCTLSQSKNTSSPPVQHPAILSILQIFRAPAPGASKECITNTQLQLHITCQYGYM